MTTSTTQDTKMGAADPGAGKWTWPTPWIDSPSPSAREARTGAHEGNPRTWSAPLALEWRSPDRPRVLAGSVPGPNALVRQHVERGQSLWVDYLTRESIVNGCLSRMVAAGIRGIIANPAPLASALEISPEYDEQVSWLFSTGCTVEEAYQELAATDVLAACAILRPTYESSQNEDGFVSVEVAPGLSGSTRGACAATHRLHQRIDRPNLLVAIPATPPGVPAVQAAVSAGRSINATSIFSIARYWAVIEAYISGLETFVAHGGDPATVHGVASFPLSPVDSEVDRRLEGLGGRAALGLRGQAAIAQARLAYRLFEERFSSDRWARLARLGATPQRLVWMSTRTARSNRYLDELSAPDTVYAVPEPAVAAALTGRGLEVRTGAPSLDVREAAGVLSEVAARGIDLDDVGVVLENQSAALAKDSLTEVFDGLRNRWGQR